MVTTQKVLFVSLLTIFGLFSLAPGSALAESSYLNSFNSQYGTSGTALDDCSLCHPRIPQLNGYGDDYANGHNYSNIQNLDSDGDGFVNIDEINALTFPGNASSFPATLPTCTDNDGDGFSVEGGECGAVDCNDASSAIKPGAQESCVDGIDNNCNGLIDNQDPLAVNCPPVCTDLDNDGYAIEGGNCGPVDCNDNSSLVNPGAAENCSDNLDNDCDSLVDVMDPDALNCPVDTPPEPVCTDNDVDGFALEGGDCGLVDCNDADAAVHPEASELCTDGLDNNCDGLVDIFDPNAIGCPVDCTDLDLDGYAVEGGECGPVDCNDQDEFINPAAAEECTDGLDNDCNDLIDIADPNVVNCPTECTDVDGDGYAIDGEACGPVDCSDGDTSINPGATEICGDGVDQDCSGEDLSCDVTLSPPVLSIQVAGVNVTVRWTAVAGATGYTLSYVPYPYTGPQSVVSVDVGDVTSVSYDLWEGAAYKVTVQAYNADGSSGYSNIEYFAIEPSNDDEKEDDSDDDSAPSPPQISLSVTGTSLSVNWQAVAGATGYTLSYAPYPYTGPKSISSIDLGNETNFNYELWEGAAYNVAVQAYNEHGQSDYSNVEYFVIATSDDADTDHDEDSDDDLDEDSDDDQDEDSGEEQGEESSDQPMENPQDVLTDGELLYSNNCASCHGPLNSSDIVGRSSAAISTAINMNAGGMGSLNSLKSEQVSAIASSLAGSAVDNTPPPVEDPTAGVTDGAILYANSCAACHGPLNNSNINNRSSAAISTAINMNAGGMGSLRSLSTSQISAIASELANATGGSTPPVDNSTDGVALYANNCASCHGSLARTDVGGEDAGDIREAIEENEGGMGMLGFLTSAQIRAIGQELDGLGDDDDDDDDD